MAYQKDIDPLKDRYALAFNKIARQAWHTAIKATNNHLDQIRERKLQIVDIAKLWILLLISDL